MAILDFLNLMIENKPHFLFGCLKRHQTRNRVCFTIMFQAKDGGFCLTRDGYFEGNTGQAKIFFDTTLLIPSQWIERGAVA
jgi:hypothetical protein